MITFIQPPFWAHPVRRGAPHQTVLFIDDDPPVEPITLAEAKLYLRIHADQTDEDALIERLITAARTYCETRLSRPIAQHRCDVFRDRLGTYDLITLPIGPVREVTSITVTDFAGVSTVIDPSLYLVDLASTPARIGLPTGQVWPQNLRRFQPIAIRLLVGDVQPPDDLVQAMRLLIGLYYEERIPIQPAREELSKFGVDDHLAPYELVQVI